MNQTYMKEKKILPLVLSMSLPMMLSMLVNSLYNIVDSYFVAQISEQAMTALSLVYPLQLLETAIAVGFGVGMNAAAAYYLGAKEQQRADDIVVILPAEAGEKHFDFEERVKLVNPRITAEGYKIGTRGFTNYILHADDMVKA